MQSPFKSLFKNSTKRQRSDDEPRAVKAATPAPQVLDNVQLRQVSGGGCAAPRGTWAKLR